MRLLSLVGFSTVILATKRLSKKWKILELVVMKMVFWTVKIVQEDFFTKIGFENHSTYEHRNDAGTQVGQLPRTTNKKDESASKKDALFEKKCPVCNISLGSYIELEMHLIGAHQIENKNQKPSSHQCKECTKAFSRGYLQIHIYTVHKNLKLHQCKECKTSFGKYMSWIYHIKHVRRIKKERKGFPSKTMRRHSKWANEQTLKQP